MRTLFLLILSIIITFGLVRLDRCCADEKTVRSLLFEPVDETRRRTVPVKVYRSESGRSQPVILFSHGLGGSRDNNEYLGRYWAAAGYVAVFMQHRGSDNEVWKSAPAGRRFAALTAAAGARSSRQRVDDVSFVIDRLEAWNEEAGHALHGAMKLERIGMSGHSFGAATTLAVAGRNYPFNRSFPEERIDAFFAMSPNLGKGLEASKAFGHLQKPILCMTGTRDGSPIDPTLKPSARREVYTALPAGNKYQLVLDGAEHFAFGDSRGGKARRRNPLHHPAIQQISLRFWDAYLKDDPKAKTWLRSKQPLSKTGLGQADIWEWK
ncbi:MAG: acetylhydrolase [Verrucomicrobiota bacterium]